MVITLKRQRGMDFSFVLVLVEGIYCHDVVRSWATNCCCSEYRSSLCSLHDFSFPYPRCQVCCRKNRSASVHLHRNQRETYDTLVITTITGYVLLFSVHVSHLLRA
jgi:hypothetical protein